MKLKVLIIDDEKDICFLISEILKDEKYQTFTALDSKEALNKFQLYKPDLVILDVWLGKKNKVDVIPYEDFYITIPKRKKSIIKSILEYEGPVNTPINKGDKLGVLKIYLSDELIKEIDILAAENVKRSNIFVRLFTSLNYLVWGDV